MSTTYFQKLNYTLANEDTRFEVAVLPEKLGHLAVIGGSGSRVLPLLSRKPERLTVLDVSQEQLWLCELRIESLRTLDYESFLGFWGYPTRIASPNERRELFERLTLSEDAREYLLQVFAEREWRSLLYLGGWERTFQKLSRVVQTLVGTENIQEFFSQPTLAEQKRYIAERFPKRRWKMVLYFMANARIFNALLYRGSFPEKNFEGTFHAFYVNAFNRLFRQGLVRENYFLQLCFFGELRYREGLPAECDPVVFERGKQALATTQIRYVRGDAIENLAALPMRADFVSLSDVPSYFKGELESGFLEKIRPALNPGARVIIRNYVHSPEGLRTGGYRETTDRFAAEIAAERMQMYDIHIYESVSP